MKHDILIIGAGLAGLCAGRALHAQGREILIVDAADGVGGRIRTDRVEGYQLDRGFQVFLDAYPEARRILDYPALRLHAFQPGALVQFQGKRHALVDPWRQPAAALGALLSPIGTFGDKLRVASLRRRALRGTIEDLFKDPETTTREILRRTGFSAAMVDRFFRPFLGGVFLEPDLSTSSRQFDFIFRMFATGSACLPAEGMEAIPRQLATGLPAERIRLQTRVASIHTGLARLDSGEEIRARSILVATDAPQAARLLGESTPVRGQAVTCLYFTAPTAPVQKPVLILNGDGTGPINNVCFPTCIAPSYGPGTGALVSVSVIGLPDEEAIRPEVERQLRSWFGACVDTWRFLRSYRIPYALPRQSAPALEVPERPVRAGPGVYVCGDHRDQGSIQGAMVSGRRAAEAILKDHP